MNRWILREEVASESTAMILNNNKCPRSYIRPWARRWSEIALRYFLSFIVIIRRYIVLRRDIKALSQNWTALVFLWSRDRQVVRMANITENPLLFKPHSTHQASPRPEPLPVKIPFSHAELPDHSQLRLPMAYPPLRRSNTSVGNVFAYEHNLGRPKMAIFGRFPCPRFEPVFPCNKARFLMLLDSKAQ
jgi:hypothetical protein